MQEQQLENQDELQIDLVEIVHVMLHRLWIIVLCAAVGALSTGIYTKVLVTPQYSTAATIYILSNNASVSGVNLNLSLSEQLTADFMLLAKSRPVVEQVIDEMGVDMTYGQLAGSVRVENPSGSHMMRVIATNPNPELAKDIANTMADVVSTRIAEVMNTDKPNIMEEAVVPGRQSSPNLRKNVMVGGLVGAGLAVGVILLLYLLDDTIKTEDDVKKYLGVNTLAAFPEQKKAKRKNIA